MFICQYTPVQSCAPGATPMPGQLGGEAPQKPLLGPAVCHPWLFLSHLGLFISDTVMLLT